MFLLYPTCLFLALRFSHLQPVTTSVSKNLAIPKESTITEENLYVDIAAKNCTEILKPQNTCTWITVTKIL